MTVRNKKKLIAETGSVMLITNEGNGDQSRQPSGA
jgi:L-lactate utilization protein LutB